MPKAQSLPPNVKLLGKKKTKHGTTRNYFLVTCIKCGAEREITRNDHATRLAKHPCKRCSNKNNHPRGEHRGIRISWFRKFEISSRNRSLEWNINIDHLADLLENQENRCALSGIPVVSNGDFSDITASLDRIDNSQGYVPGNVQVVHKHINMMRGSLSVEDFVAFCKSVASFQV